MAICKRKCEPSFGPSFHEYRGLCALPIIRLVDAKPGDIYLDQKKKEVWVKNAEWIKWEGLSEDVRHPIESHRYLNPTLTTFEWSDVAAFFSDKREAQKNYGNPVIVAEVVRKIEEHIGDPSSSTSKRQSPPDGEARALKKSRREKEDEELRVITGMGFPADTESVDWPHLQITTHLPFIRCKDLPRVV
jgi:hypothetical protein